LAAIAGCWVLGAGCPVAGSGAGRYGVLRIGSRLGTSGQAASVRAGWLGRGADRYRTLFSKYRGWRLPDDGAMCGR
jgi:hypothetical protein